MKAAIRSSLIIPALAFAGAFSAHASPAVLNQELIHHWYYSGKVDSAVRAMEYFQAKAKTYSHSDSLFLGKYLGVIYTMNPYDREKGKAWFANLLALDPAAGIDDMFAPPEVDSIFGSLKPKAAAPVPAGISKASSPAPDTLRVAGPSRPGSGPSIGVESHRKRMIWIASGLAAAAAVGVATYYIVSAEPETQTPTTPVWDASRPK